MANRPSQANRTPSPPFPARSCWSAPARWAAPCWTAGSPASCRRRRSSCWSRSRRRRSRRWRKRGVRINPKGDVGTVAALVIAVKPQTAPDALPPLAALIDPQDRRGLDHGRPHARLPRTASAAAPRSCAPCRTRRPRSAAASPSRSATRRVTAASAQARARPARRHRRGRMGRRRGADGRGHRGVGLRPGLCLPARRSDGARPAPPRACRPRSPKSSRARRSRAPANCCIARRCRPRPCARTSPRPAAPPPRRSRC